MIFVKKSEPSGPMGFLSESEFIRMHKRVILIISNIVFKISNALLRVSGAT